ncbi:MAG: carboxylating nicotinate-nucleotide diphosphorylase [Candidatus Hydrogenedentes bacterium]|nr:carboxylating nicotinate-nucleotide diphosphorylase [Candidatus Hydrogenedentota bacterium]
MLGFRSLVREALVEDIGQGDITTNATVPPNVRCKARLYAKQAGVLSGITVFRAVFEDLDADISDWYSLEDGTQFTAGQDIALFSGITRAILAGERVALNFVQRLSGVATFTAAFVAEVDDLGVRICDTRKTTPLMRNLEKQAVIHGGGANHRFALFDGVLIKENHITAAGGVTQAVQRALKGTHHLMKIGVEVTSLDEFDEALACGADAVLLDNMGVEEMQQAVERSKGSKVVLEASGNVTLDRLRAIAETGVHVISIGALTHSAPAIDLSLEITNA